MFSIARGSSKTALNFTVLMRKLGIPIVMTASGELFTYDEDGNIYYERDIDENGNIKTE